ncbi:MAG: glycosyltransferase, partial [Ignavibacterium sp.]|nr:glycosyltransferase [Ignavibacterium sp.]MDW8374635.1 glycosyltransferase [Ignavibacteriales bacterium]
MNTEKNIDVSVVIISWKMRDLLNKCLETLYHCTKEINFEVIVIDNDSQDGTYEMVKNNFPQVRLIKNS